MGGKNYDFTSNWLTVVFGGKFIKAAETCRNALTFSRESLMVWRLTLFYVAPDLTRCSAQWWGRGYLKCANYRKQVSTIVSWVSLWWVTQCSGQEGTVGDSKKKETPPIPEMEVFMVHEGTGCGQYLFLGAIRIHWNMACVPMDLMRDDVSGFLKEVLHPRRSGWQEKKNTINFSHITLFILRRPATGASCVMLHFALMPRVVRKCPLSCTYA